MGIKLHHYKNQDPKYKGVMAFYCPGCNCQHPFDLERWEWNGSMDKPTFTPSLLCNQDYPQSRCHSFVKDGMIQFLDDCWHSLKGKTVEIPDWEKDLD